MIDQTSRPSLNYIAIKDRFPNLFGEVFRPRGQIENAFDRSTTDSSDLVSGVNSPGLAGESDMCFLATPKAFADGLKSRAKFLVIPAKFKEQALATESSRIFLISSNPEMAMALVINAFFQPTPYTATATRAIHPSAFIGEQASIDPTARVGPHAYIGAHVVISGGAYVGANAVIEDHSTIGEATVIHPLVYIGHSTQIGARCEIHPSAVIAKEGFGYAHDEKFNHRRIPHQGRVVIEDDVHIGACCTIDRGTFGETRIESGVIIDNIVHIAHNNRVGRNSVLTSGFTMAGSSRIGANFVTGGKTVVTGHVEVCDNVQISALSAVGKSIVKPGPYGGHPLQSLQPYLRSQAAFMHLPYIHRMIKKIVKHLGLDDDDTSRFTE